MKGGKRFMRGGQTDLDILQAGQVFDLNQLTRYSSWINIIFIAVVLGLTIGIQFDNVNGDAYGTNLASLILAAFALAAAFGLKIFVPLTTYNRWQVFQGFVVLALFITSLLTLLYTIKNPHTKKQKDLTIANLVFVIFVFLAVIGSPMINVNVEY